MATMTFTVKMIVSIAPLIMIIVVTITALITTLITTQRGRRGPGSRYRP